MKQLIAKYKKTIWPAIIWSAFVFILLVMPVISIKKETPFEITHLDKVIHVILFLVLVLLWGFYIKNILLVKSKFLLTLSVVFILSVCYGIIMEYVQLWVGRDFDLWDMVADAVGAFIGWLYYAVKK